MGLQNDRAYTINILITEGNDLGIIDVHSHFLTDKYVLALKEHDKLNEDGFPLPQWSLENQLNYMDQAGIDKSILSISSPHPYMGTAAEAKALVRSINDEMASIKNQYPQRFLTAACLPLPDIEASLEEIDYACEILKADAFKLSTNADGLYLDNPSMQPVYEKLNEHKAIVILHPTKPWAYPEDCFTGKLLPLYEFLGDTTRSVVNLIASGMLSQYPDIKIIVPHCGSFLPNIISRLENITKLLETQGKGKAVDVKTVVRQLYFDVAGDAFPAAYNILKTMTDEDHILFGGDYPYTPAEIICQKVKTMETMDSKDVINKISYENAQKLFGLEPKRQRRIRYSGTHPKRYEEKYKELHPEKYGDTISRVIQKGSTPAGMHISICVKEILDFLQIKPGQKGLDATLGYGGHTKEMLKCLKSKGHIYALDIDPIESEKTKKRLEEAGFGSDILTIKQMNFANIDQVAEEVGKFDFVLADLGVSSMQIDNPERGFSFKYEGPLDLRLNPKQGQPASQRLRDMTQAEIQGMLFENSDEPYAEEISKAIIQEFKKGNKIETTTQLKQVIEKALSFIPEKEQKEAVKKSCQRSFQALRIDVNSEFEVLEMFLEKLPDVLASGGRVAILTFHSGEDRLVKKTFKRMKKQGIYSEIADEVIRPSAEECNLNSRARSTKMRWAIKA